MKDNIKTVPNQKIVRVNKEPVAGQLFAQINLDAMEQAGRNLDAGAFKLWCYFSKNQNKYTFALSSADAEATMGIKIKQYNNAVKQLIDKGYLVQCGTNPNHYNFFEVSKTVIPKGNNIVISKEDKSLSPEGIRNITDNTQYNTLWYNNEWYRER